MGKHQLYEYPAAVLQSLRPLSVLGLAGGGEVVVGGGGELGPVLHCGAAHCGSVTSTKVLSVHHHRHCVAVYLSLHQIEQVLFDARYQHLF